MAEIATVGSPEEIRAAAAALRAQAARLQGCSGGATKAQGISFEGPAAERLRATAAAVASDIAGVAGEIEGLSASLMADANTVESMNAELAREAAAEKAEQQADSAQAANPSSEASGEASA